ncbi:PorT family protein [Flavobacterium agricola]|uniref:PorT family protein n=1 Tax=Flavobacterium agricola TaxID=2870839 RepID=A0ABY6M4V8_9FLAO|nr:PorT family protein [Flavobacterium agricola]UYW02496.1 PorT family protein [Flavobacterium agricola]
MKNKYIVLFSFFALLGFAPQIFAQTTEEEPQKTKNFFNTNTEYRVKAQFSIGGASPLGLPAQIRKVESYNPTLQLGLGLDATKWFTDSQKLGLRIGLAFEGRGMKTNARVKNYYTQIEDDTGAQTKGYFTGRVVTEMNNSYITFPVSLVWNATPKWNFYAGMYFSGLIDRNFKGHIYDGNFREGTPVGELTVFEGTARGIYDFSDDLARFQFGNQLGAEFEVNKSLRIFADVTMANNQVFKHDFEAISFKMYNIYGNIGFAYVFL